MKDEPLLIIVGGFLGAGKTTLLDRAARALDQRGRRVGLITNDQSIHLVDTARLGSGDQAVEEVGGGCFCCRFDDLVAAADRLRREGRDVILAEEPDLFIFAGDNVYGDTKNMAVLRAAY